MERFRASVEAVRRGEEPPEDGYQRRLRRASSRARRAIRCRAMLEQIEATLERFRIHFDTWERQSVVEAEIPEAVALLDTYEEDGAVWARTSAHGDEKDRVLVRSRRRRRRTSRPTRRTFGGSTRAASTGSIYVLGADHHGYVALAAALARDARPPTRVARGARSTSSSTSSRAARRRRCRSGAATSSSSTSFIDEIGVDAARWYLVSRGHDQTIEIDVDLAAERTKKNPVYYVQYAHARIAGILRNAPSGRGVDAASSRPAARAAEERDLVKRLARVSRRSLPRRPSGAAPHAIPTYAIRVADDFHRFYHHHRVLESRAAGFRLALVPRDADRDRALPRPRRGRGAGADVGSRPMA